jgi:glycosyltransferase involved in cell wall biosynthesis
MEKSRLRNSFLIATNRTYETHAKLVVDQLESYGALDDGEIIICCPFVIEDSRIKYIKDEKNLNGNTAFNEAARHSCGEYIYILCDDHLVSEGIIRGDDFLNSPLFLNSGCDVPRKYKIATMMSGGVCYIGAIPGFPQTNFLPRTVMCRFPFFDRETYVKHLNSHVFHPDFNLCSHFADNYLSYFLHLKGEPPVECPFITLTEIPNTEQFDDGSVEPFGGDQGKYPTGYEPSLEVYIKLCKNLQKTGRHVSL